MQLNVLGRNLQLLGIIDNFSSLIWTKRFQECGDFEVYVRADSEMLALFQQGTYVSRNDDDMICIIETIRLDTDVENGNYLTISGRCLKSLLERRIIWYQTNLYGRVDLALEQLIVSNIIDADHGQRNMWQLTMGTVPYTEDTINKQITGDNLFTTVIDYCKSYDWGFEIVRQSESSRFFVINIFNGTDRSISQSVNPRVVFSAEYDNLPRTNYLYSRTNYKNTARVAGEGEGTLRKITVVGNENEDIDRYEMFVDARDISSNDGEIADYDYYQLLTRRGMDKLTSADIINDVDGEIDATEQYVYKKDYFVGDKVTIKTEYGITATARILEVIECEDETGYKIIPTFSSWEV